MTPLTFITDRIAHGGWRCLAQCMASGRMLRGVRTAPDRELDSLPILWWRTEELSRDNPLEREVQTHQVISRIYKQSRQLTSCKT